MANSRSLIPLSFVSSLQKGPQMPRQFSLASLLCIPVSLHNKNVLLRCLINGIRSLVVEFFHFVVIIDQNHTKGSQERFFTVQNKAKCENFRGNCLFQSYVLLLLLSLLLLLLLLLLLISCLLDSCWRKRARNWRIEWMTSKKKRKKKSELFLFVLFVFAIYGLVNLRLNKV